MAGTRDLTDGFETTETVSRWSGSSSGLNLDPSLVKTAATDVAIGAAETTGTMSITANGYTHTLVVVVPDWTNTVTCTVTIANSDGDDIYQSDALVQNTTHVCNMTGSNERPIVGTNVITLTLSGVPGGTGGTAVVALYLKGGK